MTLMTTALALGLTVLAADKTATASEKDISGGEELRCDRIKIVEVADDQEGKIAVRTPGDIPLDTKLVTVSKKTVSIQPVADKGKPALDMQTFRIVNARATAIHAVQESTTNITALALDRMTGRMVLSRATAGDELAPGTTGHIAYFRCSRLGK